MANIINQYGQVKLGVRYVSAPLTSTLWGNIYSVYNADSVGSSSLKTSLFAAYNGESNANDSFGSNNGTPQGGLTYGTGKIGNAFQFNGSNAYVSLPDNSLNLTGDFTVSTWVNFSSFPSVSTIISNYYRLPPYAVYYGWSVLMISNQIAFDIFTGVNNSSVRLLSPSIPTNTWKHVTLIHKKNVSLSIYIDGVLSVSTATTFPIGYSGNETPAIGGTLPGTGFQYPTNGKIDALNIWTKELTASEIIELYNSGNGAQYITDSFYKPTTNDALNTNNGTAQGGLTYTPGKVGTAFQFNGTTSYVSLPTGAFHSLTTDFSVSAWVSFPSGYSTQIPIFSNISATSWFSNVGGFWLTIFGYGIQFRIGDKTVGPHDTTTTILTGNISPFPPSNTFVHIVATRKAGQRSRIYYNGTLIANNTDARNPAYYTSGVNTTTPTIGNVKIPNGVQDSYYAPNGTKIDGLSVWSKELTQADVTELYNSGNGKQYTN